MFRTVSSFLIAAVSIVAVLGAQHQPARAAAVQLVRVPNGGIQPEVVRDAAGVMHVLYFLGEPAAGDLFYVRSPDDGATFSAPVRVNSQHGSAVGAGMIRGGQLAVGRDGRLHVAWNGSTAAMPTAPIDIKSRKPGPAMLYARSNPAGSAFEPQRSVMQRSVTLDGGGSIAADHVGNVYIAWHANDAATGNTGEGSRRLFVARSTDHGAHFEPEQPASHEPTGACGCCGVRALATERAGLLVLFRTATDSVNRDIFLLQSTDRGRRFSGARVHGWHIAACPMTSMSLAEGHSTIAAAWETEGQVYFGRVDAQSAIVSSVRGADGDARPRKHPRLAVNADDRLLMVWTERASAARVGTVAWQLFDRDGKALDADSRKSGLPVMSYAAAAVRRDGGFTVLY